MNTEWLARKMTEGSQRVAVLRDRLTQSATEAPDTVAEALTELDSALEELRVAQEELRQQNEQLIKARQEAEVERRRYQDLFQFAPEAYFVTDMHGAIQEANQTAAAMLGLRPELLAGNLLIAFVPENGRRAFRDELTRLAQVKGPYEWELELAPRQGPVFPASLRVSRIVGQQTSGPDGLRWLARDLTPRNRVEELAQANRHKDDFLAMLAHELRNPLAPIRNVIQLMRLWESTDSDLAWVTDVLDRQVRQLTHLVDDLMDISRIARRKIDLRTECVPMAPSVADAVESVSPLVAARRHSLDVQLPPEAIYVMADARRLTQIVTNLLTNAAKYTDPGGRIAVQVARDQTDVVLRVSDNGIGLTPDMLGRIFQPFVQAEPLEKRSQGGLGIGLSLVKRLVELHGGSVQAFSDGLGKGCEFVVRLPTLSAETVAAYRPQDEPCASSRPLRVLVVDHRDDAAESLAVLLRLWGHVVRMAGDGPTALAEAGTFDPEVVLLDIGLPGMSGYEVAQRLRQEMPRTQRLLIALTGFGHDDDRERSSRAGFDMHLTKPVDPEMLGRRLREFALTGR